MKTEIQKSKDGEKTYAKNHPEVGDVFTCVEEKPYKSPERLGVTTEGVAFKAHDYLIRVKSKDSSEPIMLTITKGMYNLLIKKGNIKNKDITFKLYTAKYRDANGQEHERENTLGVRLIEDDRQTPSV